YSFLYIQRGKSVQFQYNKTVTGEDPKLEVKYWCLNPATPTDGEERDIKIDEQSLVCDACVNVSTMEKKLTEDQNSISFEVKNVVGGLVALTHIKVTFKIKQECTWEEDCKKTWDFKTEDVVNPLDDLKTDDKYLLLKRNTESTLKRTVKGSFKEIFVQLQYKCNSVNPSYSKLSLTPENVKLTCDGAWNNITVPESNEVFRIGNLEANISIVIAFNETESEVTITVKKSQNTDYIALKDIKVVTTENKDNGDEKFSEDKETRK
ncbi:uncharacterized protein LOC111088218, partial [Limulus polyphemus]|uniref:Uncharacterized protein LOC111088218 n=1 Tax=Limulus polyphemus TaxID=6850 RepID=A0ABM1TBT0_LIMPO